MIFVLVIIFQSTIFSFFWSIRYVKDFLTESEGKTEVVFPASIPNGFEKFSKKWQTFKNIFVNLNVTSLIERNSNEKEIFLQNKPIHFVFIGDSRIRQHFLNVLKVRNSL
jgi:hypothetical protein